MNSNRLFYLFACATVGGIMVSFVGCSQPIAEPVIVETKFSEPEIEKTNTEEPNPVSTESAAARLTAARKHLSEGRYTDSIKITEELTREFPGKTTYQFLLGEAAFMVGAVERSSDVFNRLIEINPKMKSSLWQRGLALYYAGKFEEGVDQFTVHQTVNTQDVENSVWHLMCQARTIGIEEARKQMIPIQFDTRPAMTEIHQMFAGKLQPEDVLEAAKSAIVSDAQQTKVNLYYAHLYTGLYYEMIGQPEDSIASMKKAVAVVPDEKGVLMLQVAKVHLHVREGKSIDDE